MRDGRVCNGKQYCCRLDLTKSMSGANTVIQSVMSSLLSPYKGRPLPTLMEPTRGEI